MAANSPRPPWSLVCPRCSSPPEQLQPPPRWRLLPNTVELDHVGLCWDLDLVPEGPLWAARTFRGSAWSRLHQALAAQDRRNAYRVLLTRSRRGTIVWVPRGDARDPSRPPGLYDAVAARLLRCGAAMLDNAQGVVAIEPLPDPVLL